MSGEKTEQPTAKKLRDARKDGQVARSADFTGAVVMTAALAATLLVAPTAIGELARFMVQTVSFATSPFATPSGAAAHLAAGLAVATPLMLPILGTGFVAAALVSYLQVGPGFSTKSLVPDGSRLNAAAGLKRMFSKDRLVDLVKNLTRLAIMTLIAWATFDGGLRAVLQTPRGSVWNAMQLLGEAALRQTQYLLMALGFFAVIDLLWQRHSHIKKLRMAKSEVKQEYKQAEGDPHIRAARKRMHQELAKGAGVRRVKDADAVVVNPVHVAAAIRYRSEEHGAPVLIASGRGDTAKQIRKEAARHGVPVIRNIQLARSLADLELEDEIPEELYEAVAAVLQFVYSLGDPAADR